MAFIRLRSKTTGEWLAHPDLRAKLLADADEQETNLTDVIRRILADRYRVPYEAGGRPTSPGNDNDVINIGDVLGMQLETTIKMAAARRGWTWIDQIRHDLCAQYELTVPPKPKYSRRASTAA